MLSCSSVTFHLETGSQSWSSCWGIAVLFSCFAIFRVWFWPPSCKKIAIPSCRPHACIPGRKKVEEYKAFSMCDIGILNFGGEDIHSEFHSHFMGWEQEQHKNLITWLLFIAVESGKTCILASMPLNRGRYGRKVFWGSFE